jgi:hypothetical protein
MKMGRNKRKLRKKAKDKGKGSNGEIQSWASYF